MQFNKRNILLVFVIIIAIFQSSIILEIRFFLSNHLNFSLLYLYISIPFYILFTVFFSIVIIQLKRKNLIFTVILFIALISRFLFGWIKFYEYQQDHSKIDALNIRDCFLERNYPDYYTYLTKGCHISIYDVVLGLFVLAFSYISVFIITNLIYTKQKKKNKTDQFLIDN
jgi:hypothetical protein